MVVFLGSRVKFHSENVKNDCIGDASTNKLGRFVMPATFIFGVLFRVHDRFKRTFFDNTEKLPGRTATLLLCVTPPSTVTYRPSVGL